MTAAEMDIIIGANVDQAIAGLNKLGYSITKVEGQTEQLGNEFGLSTRHALGFSQGLTELTAEASRGELSTRGFFEVLRVGATEFRNIQEETGSTATAFKALGGALFSEETIILLAVTALATFAGHLLNTKEKTDEAKKAQDEFTKSLQGAEASALSNGIKLQALVAIGADHTKSLTERNYALTEANKLMGEHGEKITAANVATKAITEQTNLYTQALIQEAVAAKYSDQLADFIIKKTAASEAYGKALKENDEAQKALNEDARKQTTSFGSFAISQRAIDANNALIKATSDYINARDGATEADKNFNIAEQQAISLMGQLGTKTKEATNATKDYITPRIKIFKGDNLDIVRRDAQDVINQTQTAINKGPGLNIPVHVDITPEDAKKIADQVNIMMTGIEDAFTAVGEGIGNALTGKGGLFSGIFQALGGMLETLGKYVIATSTLLAKIKDALIAAFDGTPLAGIAVGVGLVALGAVLKNVSGMIKFATGGVVTRPTLALVGEQGPERITPLGYEGQARNVMAGEVVFNISGQNLRGILRLADQTAYNTF